MRHGLPLASTPNPLRNKVLPGVDFVVGMRFELSLGADSV